MGGHWKTPAFLHLNGFSEQNPRSSHFWSEVGGGLQERNLEYDLANIGVGSRGCTIDAVKRTRSPAIWRRLHFDLMLENSGDWPAPWKIKKDF